MTAIVLYIHHWYMYWFWVTWVDWCFFVCLVSRITLRVTSPSLPQFHQCCVSSSTTFWSTGKTNTSAHFLHYLARASALWFQMPINQGGTLRFAVQILQQLKSSICLSSHKKQKCFLKQAQKVATSCAAQTKHLSQPKLNQLIHTVSCSSVLWYLCNCCQFLYS